MFKVIKIHLKTLFGIRRSSEIQENRNRGRFYALQRMELIQIGTYAYVI